ncbi:DNA polymerase III subunit gamma/tau [Glaciecola sp. XM2]|uniref:DNA polymerase III subunit gamma/tau n=1 Tax=Glaciecola sp. XM2 TaxID=1914931 RepID=UPI001BDE0247|nr:DNA polymerase III subunit gamma/tau [Glaciecola sp. XM2]MBT1449867.1 DNA polymerase III subunit gamma/tau [Glaciecola sp. XM2]
MSYQVLARKWRPQTFSELVGQQHVVDAITNALDNDKLHHAYLFTGTRGVGKTTIARIFSKSLNCEEGQSANPCGKCATCQDISDGRYVDLLEIDAASRTKVEDTRELLDNVQYKPTRGKYKVYLIDEVHMLSKHSFNALLKTLEEPPEHVKFLLATTDPQKLPVTILSRCLQFSLKALSAEQIQGQLSHILSAENIQFEPSALAQLARAAAGSMRDALSLTDQAIAQGNNTVMPNAVVQMLGLLDKNQVLRLAKYIAERDHANAMAQLDEICADSPDYAQVLSQLLALLHQIALTQIVPDICKLDTTVAKPIYTLSKSISSEHIQLLYQIGLNGKRDLPFAPDPLTGLQMTIMRMLAFSPAQTVPLDVNDLAAQGAPSDSAPSPVDNNPPIETKNDEQAQRLVLQNEQNAPVPQPDANAEPAAPVEQTEQHHQHESVVERQAPDTHVDREPEELPSHDELQDEMLAAQQADANYDEMPEHDVHTTEAKAPSEAEEPDSVSLLQDLFDMEEDCESYEKQVVDNDTGKKSDITATETPKAVSVAHTLPESLAETFSEPLENDSNEKNDAPQSDTAPPIVDEANIDATAPFMGSENLKITSHLANGDKLTDAAQIDKWSAFVDALDVRGLSRQLLIHGRCNGIVNRQLKLQISEAHQHLNEPRSVETIREALKDKFQQDIEVIVEYAEVADTPYELQQSIDAMRLTHAKQIINQDAAIQELTQAFEASVIEESIKAR